MDREGRECAYDRNAPKYRKEGGKERTRAQPGVEESTS